MERKFQDATDFILQRLKEPEDCGDDTDSNSDLDIDAWFVVIIWKFEITLINILIFACIKYCNFSLNRKIRN